MTKPLWSDKKPEPPKEYKSVMDYKNTQIKKFSDEKQESMRLMSSGRDATIIVSTHYKDISEEEIKEKILMWRKFFYTEIYGHNEDFYKQNNDPLK